MFTAAIMRSLWPHGDAEIPGLVDAIAATAPAAFATFGLGSDLLVAHAMAQFSHECGAGNEVVENLNYSAQGLMTTWPSRFDAAKAADFARDPQRIANEVYDGRMGNRPGSDDGWTYRGRGGSQVTGREAYAALGTKLGLDLLDNPDLVNDPAHFIACALADFVLCGCLPFAAADDVSGVTYHLNGGFIGLAERTAWLARWKSALGGDAAQTPDTVWIQQTLDTLGADPVLSVDGAYGPATVSAVQAFQRAHGLAADGKAGPMTIAALQAALKSAGSPATITPS